MSVLKLEDLANLLINRWYVVMFVITFIIGNYADIQTFYKWMLFVMIVVAVRIYTFLIVEGTKKRMRD